MDKIFHSTFDFFTHALPGFCIAAAFFILDPALNTAQDFIEKANQIKLGGGVFLLVIGYVIGFAINPLGRSLYRKFGFRLCKETMTNNVRVFIADKYVLVREFSPNNFKYIETWNMFCAMSHNLAISSILVAGFCLVKVAFQHPANLVFWLSLSMACSAFFLIFLYRAARFSIWAADDLNAAIARLKFLERAAAIDTKASDGKEDASA